MQVNFELLYAPVARQWKLFGISVNLGGGSPEALEVAAPPVARQSIEVPDPPSASVKPKKP